MGLSQSELARLSGVTRATVAQIEEGRVKTPNASVIRILAKTTTPGSLVEEYVLWKNDEITEQLSPRARNVLLLPPSVVATYSSFPVWMKDVATNPTQFASLLKVPRSTVVKYLGGSISMPSSLEYAFANRLKLSEEYIDAVRGLDVGH